MTPFIVTFYSYKGGVGRSLLAANIGVLSARRGKTLLWDLDIEAPGLHNIPGLTPSKPVKEGFFEWLISWQESGKASNKADFGKLVKLACQTPEQDRLFILPAYGDHKDFAGLFQSIRWDDFLVRDLDTGLALFRGILDAFGKAGFETVLLDSRTGITDIGGLLAALLPHTTVLVGNYGRQNTRGLAHVWQALQPASEGRIAARGTLPPLTRLLVASPIADENELISIGKAVWKDEFGIDLTELVTIPFDKRLLFTEELYAATRTDTSVAKAYNDLERRIDKVRLQVIAERELVSRSDDARPDLIIRSNKDSHAQGKSFEERVAHLLRLLGYSVEREQLIDSNRVDLVARKRADFGREEVYFVECKDHQAVIPKETVQIFKTWLDGPTAREMQARGMVVAANDFSPAARGYAREQGMQVLTYDELERSLFDFSSYLARIRQRYEASALAGTYVDQYLLLEKQPDEKPVPMLPHALEWVSGNGSRLWLVLGDYGTGKSTLVERLAYELARNCENNQENPIPVEINLRQFPNAISLESLIHEHLETELRTRLNPEIVLHLLEAGRVVLLLDSFDEMGVAQAGKSVEEQFRQLARPTANSGRNPRANRVLITSRSHFFRDTKSAMQAVQGGDKLFEADSALGKAARAFDATLDTLPVFTNEQIADYLQKRLGTVEGDRARRFIEETYGLREIASTPQLLDMVVASLPDLMKQGEKVTTTSLYLTYTNRWLNTVRLKEAEVGIDHMRDLLERMACELWRRPRNQIHYADLAALLRQEQGLARGIDSERVDLELRTASFLVRSADGFYRFSHRSFLEFFFARALFRALNEGNFAESLACGRVNSEATTFLIELTESMVETATKLNETIRTILSNPYTEIISENALLIAYRTAQYRIKATTGSDNVIRYTKEFQEAQQPLIPLKANMAGARLAKTSLTGLWAEQSDFSGADLTEARLSLAWLKGGRFEGAKLDDAALVGAKMEDANLVGTSSKHINGQGLHIERANCLNAVFDGANLCRLQARHTDFSFASLRLTRLADAQLEQANLSTTDLSGATWPHSQDYCETGGFSPEKPHIAGLVGHDGPILSCTFSPDDLRLLTSGNDGTARLWDVATGKELRQFRGHDGSVLDCAFSPDGVLLLTAGCDGTARLWETNSGIQVRQFEGHDAPVAFCVFSPDGILVLTADNNGTAYLWETNSGLEVKHFKAHSGIIKACAFSSEGALIITDNHGGGVSLWEVATEKELRQFKSEDLTKTCALSQDSSRLITVGNDHTAYLWDVKSGKKIHQFRSPNFMARVSSVLFSPDASLVLFTNLFRRMSVWDTESFMEIRDLDVFGYRVWTSAFSRNTSLIITAGKNGIVLLDAQSGMEIRHWIRSRNNLQAFVFSSIAKALFTFSNDGFLRQWDVKTGKEYGRIKVREEHIIRSIFSLDGSRLLTVNQEYRGRVWDAGSGLELKHIEWHNHDILDGTFSPDNTRLLTAGKHGTVCLWNINTGKEMRRFNGHDESVYDCAFSPDGAHVLTAGEDGTVRLWNTETGLELLCFKGHRGAVDICIFSPDGLLIFSAGSDRTPRLWDTNSGKELRRFDWQANPVSFATFSPDGTRILAAGIDSSVGLWNVKTGKELRSFVAHGGSVNTCIFSPAGSQVFTASDDGIVRLWDTETGKELLIMVASGDSWISWRPGENRWEGEGELTEQLRYEDESDVPTGDPNWVPRHWLAADLPELRGLTPLSQLKPHLD